MVLRVFSNPVANVFQKQLTADGHHPLAVNFLTYLLLSLVCIFIAIGVPGQSLHPSFWLYSLLGGMAGALGNAFLVRALQHGDLSVLGPVNAYKSVVGLLFGLLLLGEVPSALGLLGVALIIAGSYFVLDTTEDRFSWKLLKRREIRFRLWAMVLTAIEAVFIKKVILAASPTIAFISWCCFGAFFSFLLVCLNRQGAPGIFPALTRTGLYRYIGLVACIGTMQFTTNFVLDRMPVGYALSLFQLSTIVSIWLGYRVFREKDIFKKLVGTAIMLLGSVVILLFNNS